MPLRSPSPRFRRTARLTAWGLALSLLLVACGLDLDFVPTPPGIGGVPEQYDGDRSGDIRTETLLLPWSSEAVEVTVEVIDGYAIYEGDIILGRVDASGDIVGRQSIAREDSDYRWSDATVIYRIDSGLSSTLRSRVEDAIDHWETHTDIRFELRDGEEGYVLFTDGDGCSSDVGYQGTKQEIFLSASCGTGNIIHEIGHAVGLIHEQSRSDRDDWVDILENNIEDGKEGNFDLRNEDGFDLGEYDYCSIMHYGRTFFGTTKSDGSKRQTIDPLQPIPSETFVTGDTCSDIGQRRSLSAGDLAAVRLLYPRETLIWYQDRPDMRGDSEAGDFFGSALAAGDFDGDGILDLAIGVPREDVGDLEDAGAVNVLYGTDTGLRSDGDQLFTQASAGVPGVVEAGDNFGAALAVGDFDGDGFDDLAVGAWGEAVGSLANAGAVVILYGSPAGLGGDGSQLWHQDTSGVTGAAEAGDLFGYALAAGDFDDDGADDLAIGVLTEDIDDPGGEVADSGAVQVLFGARGAGLTADGDLLLHAGTLGLAELPLQPYIHLGAALAAGDFDNDGHHDLALSAPLAGGGAVVVIPGGDAGLGAASYWDQDVAGVAGVVEPGDRFGSALAVGDFDADGRDDLAIGIENEAIGALSGAGAVQVLYGGSGGLAAAGSQLWHQDSGGVKGVAESGDRFGAALAAGDFDGDGNDDLAIGVPGEDLGDVLSAGAVNLLFGDAAGLSDRDRLWHQSSPGASGVPEAYDAFGAALAAGDFDGDGDADLAVGVLRESIGDIADAGAVNLLYYHD